MIVRPERLRTYRRAGEWRSAIHAGYVHYKVVDMANKVLIRMFERTGDFSYVLVLYTEIVQSLKLKSTKRLQTSQVTMITNVIQPPRTTGRTEFDVPISSLGQTAFYPQVTARPRKQYRRRLHYPGPESDLEAKRVILRARRYDTDLKEIG